MTLYLCLRLPPVTRIVKEDLLSLGERIWNLERLFNIEAGFSGTDDTLPRRMLEEPMPEGPARGQVCKTARDAAGILYHTGLERSGSSNGRKTGVIRAGVTVQQWELCLVRAYHHTFGGGKDFEET